jgi:hypothetical protein
MLTIVEKRSILNLMKERNSPSSFKEVLTKEKT